jgi:hypothetical protein
MSLFSEHKNYCNCLVDEKHNDDALQEYDLKELLGIRNYVKVFKLTKLW